MLNEYYGETIPILMAELEDIYAELCQIVADAIFNGSDIIASKVEIWGRKIALWARSRDYRALNMFKQRVTINRIGTIILCRPTIRKNASTA